jgi:hypothetical protein
MQRRRSVPHTFEYRLAVEKSRLEAQLAHLPPGPQKEALLKKIRQLETASHISGFHRPGCGREPKNKTASVGGLTSPGGRP